MSNTLVSIGVNIGRAVTKWFDVIRIGRAVYEKCVVISFGMTIVVPLSLKRNQKKTLQLTYPCFDQDLL